MSTKISMYLKLTVLLKISFLDFNCVITNNSELIYRLYHNNKTPRLQITTLQLTVIKKCKKRTFILITDGHCINVNIGLTSLAFI